MIRTHFSTAATPAERGEEFGAANASAIATTLDRYQQLFDFLAGERVDLRQPGGDALRVIGEFSSDADAEIRAIAGGAGLQPWQVAALNARTEVLAQISSATRGECTTVVALGSDGTASTIQTWDWFDTFADGWFVWTIEHPDGHVVHTLTEYGVLGKIGVSTHRLGVHMNIIHHRSDGGAMGVPVHVLARAVLDRARDGGDAVTMLGAAVTAVTAVTAGSAVLTVTACADGNATAASVELAPAGPRFVLPSEQGILLHTNHFLDPYLAAGDREPRVGPDSYLRMDVLRRGVRRLAQHDRDALRGLLSDHSAGNASICCHAAASAPLGDRWETLATVAIDPRAAQLAVLPGGPCREESEWKLFGTPAGV